MLPTIASHCAGTAPAGITGEVADGAGNASGDTSGAVHNARSATIHSRRLPMRADGPSNGVSMLGSVIVPMSPAVTRTLARLAAGVHSPAPASPVVAAPSPSRPASATDAPLSKPASIGDAPASIA